MEKEKKHGGFRRGAGRKTDSPKTPFSFYLEDEIREKMKEIKNKSVLINRALREYFEKIDSKIEEYETIN